MQKQLDPKIKTRKQGRSAPITVNVYININRIGGAHSVLLVLQ